VRKAYVAGESAPSVARRFDVGLSNLRRRAMAEGWTRSRIAEQLDLQPLRGGADGPSSGLLPLPEGQAAWDLPLLDPEETIVLALNRATWLVSQGRAAEARALSLAVEALERIWDAAAAREKVKGAGERR
jgi:hypothetical protein